ncbi:MAG: hypothetical protein IJB52_06655, partial [Clostridia bacterium]|nr:hypothetical protein [Clostridia bacterium]
TNSNIFNRVTPVFYELANLTWGVVGLGNIGGKVANVAKALGCNVIAYKRKNIKNSSIFFSIPYAGMDFISKL